MLTSLPRVSQSCMPQYLIAALGLAFGSHSQCKIGSEWHFEGRSVGSEHECKLRYRGKTISGKAQLESDHLLFRGTERIKIMLKDVTRVGAKDGILTVAFRGGPAAFELGPRADTSAEKMLNPPSPMHNMG